MNEDFQQIESFSAKAGGFYHKETKETDSYSAEQQKLRQELAKVVISALGKEDFIFGGFVRHQVEGLPFNDIDIICNSKINCCWTHAREDSFNKMIGSLRSKFEPKGYRVKVDISRLAYNKFKPIYKRDVSIFDQDNKKILDIDLMVTRDNDPFSVIDFDVNCLTIGNDGEIRAAPGFAKNELILNITNRKCKKNKSVDWRIDKFIREGYTIINDLEKIKQENKIMAATTTKQSFMQMSKEDGEEALYRVGATQMSKAAKRTIVAVLKSKGALGSKGKKQAKSSELAIQEILDSPLGDIFVSGMLGYGLTYVPGFGQDPRIQRLAKEFRVGAMTQAGNEIMGVAMESFLPEISGILDKLPEVKEVAKTRVAAPTDEAIEAEVEHEAEEAQQAEAKPQLRA
jgi:hypothetical protein